MTEFDRMNVRYHGVWVQTTNEAPRMMARLETKVLAVDCVRKIIEMVDESETSHFDLTEANQFKEDHNGVSDRLVHMLSFPCSKKGVAGA